MYFVAVAVRFEVIIKVKAKFNTQDVAYKGPDIEQWLACAKLSPTSLMYMSDGYNDYRWQRYTLREDR